MTASRHVEDAGQRAKRLARKGGAIAARRLLNRKSVRCELALHRKIVGCNQFQATGARCRPEVRRRCRIACGEAVGQLDRLDHRWDHHPDARRLLGRAYQEPVHRADSSGPGHRVRRRDGARGGWPLTGLFRLIGLAFGPPSIWGPVAQRGQTSRGGNSRGSSTSPSISRSRSG